MQVCERMATVVVAMIAVLPELLKISSLEYKQRTQPTFDHL